VGGPPRVLVVEHNEGILEMLEDVLADAGYEVAAARHEGEALAALDAGPPPDAVVLDLVLPRVDGWAFARQYRRRPGPHAPIVALTADGPAGCRGATRPRGAGPSGARAQAV
jgi:CheY-like chemotaxis protein